MKKYTALILAAILSIPLLITGCKKSSTTADVGTWKDGAYTNAFTGVAYTLPEGWTALDNDALFEINGLSNANMAADATPDVEALLKSIQVATLMEADAPNSGGRVALSLASLANYGTSTTAKQYMETFKEQLTSVAKYTYVFDDGEKTVKIGKESYHMYTAEAFGISDSNQMYSAFYRAFCLRKVSGRMVIVEVVAPTRENIDTYLGYFL